MKAATHIRYEGDLKEDAIAILFVSGLLLVTVLAILWFTAFFFRLGI